MIVCEIAILSAKIVVSFDAVAQEIAFEQICNSKMTLKSLIRYSVYHISD